MITSCCACVGIRNNNKFNQFITYLQVVPTETNFVVKTIYNFTKGKRSVGHLSSMFSVDKVLLGECSMLNTELVIAKIQKQIFHIPDFVL